MSWPDVKLILQTNNQIICQIIIYYILTVYKLFVQIIWKMIVI